MSPHLSLQRRSPDGQPFDGVLPDMIEVVQLACSSGRGPVLVVSQRKVSAPLLARLRRLADETDDA